MGADATGAAPTGEELSAAADSPLPTPPARPGVAVRDDEPGDTTDAPFARKGVDWSAVSMLAVGDVGADPDDADDISDDSAPLADSVAPDD
jgi:hypothetical protein